MKPNIIVRFLGLHDKKQKARTEAISQYAERKREEFVLEMDKVRAQTKRVHARQLQVSRETAKLVDMVDDVTKKIMIATGGLSRG